MPCGRRSSRARRHPARGRLGRGSLATSVVKMAQDVAALEVFERFLAADLPVDEESLALDAFREVGPGGTFLGARTRSELPRGRGPAG